MQSNEKKVPATAYAALEISDKQPLDCLWKLQAIDYLLTHLDPDIEPDAAQMGHIFELIQQFHERLNAGLSELDKVKIAA